MLDFQQWRERIEELLSDLSEINFGYPLGVNELHAPQSPQKVRIALESVGLTQHADLFQFYSVCDGLSWPDVENGYFIDRVASLTRSRTKEFAIHRISGKQDYDVVPFGSLGGGEQFVIRQENGNTLFLPAGHVEAGVYHNTDDRVMLISTDFSQFATQLLETLETFV